MRKIILSLTLAALIFAGCTANSAKITQDRAKEIALEHAGVMKDDATFLRAEHERENGKSIYEVEFYSSGNKEYDYEIDAETGEIISYDFDAEDFKLPDKETSATHNEQGKTEGITENEAKEIATKKVPGATDANIREFKKERDDGREKYEGKIIYDNMEYEFEIDAADGKIIQWEKESLYD